MSYCEPKPLSFSDEGPKPLMCDDDKPVKKDGPKSLAFPESTPPRRHNDGASWSTDVSPSSNVGKALFNTNNVKQHVSGVKLSFDNLPPVVVKTPGKAAFASETSVYDPIIASAMKHVRDNYQTLSVEMPSIERQIKQLIPVKMSTISTWGSSALDQEAQLSTNIAQMVRTFSGIRGNELMEKVLNLAKAVRSEGFLDKLFGSTQESALQYKPQLGVLKTQLTQLMPEYEQNIKNASASETRIMIQFAALVAVKEATGTSGDDSLERAILDRRNILQQAAMQSKLSRLQLIETQKSIAQQISRVEQLLTVTLPAFEMATAQQQK